MNLGALSVLALLATCAEPATQPVAQAQNPVDAAVIPAEAPDPAPEPTAEAKVAAAPDSPKVSPRPPMRADDAKVIVDGQALELSEVDGQCVVERTAGGIPSRLETGLQAPCYWTRWEDSTSRPKSSDGMRIGLKAGDVQAYRFVDQKHVFMALIGSPIIEPRVFEDEINVLRMNDGYHCGGQLRPIHVEKSGLRAGKMSSDPFECVELSPEIKELWVLSHPVK